MSTTIFVYDTSSPLLSSATLVMADTYNLVANDYNGGFKSGKQRDRGQDVFVFALFLRSRRYDDTCLPRRGICHQKKNKYDVNRSSASHPRCCRKHNLNTHRLHDLPFPVLFFIGGSSWLFFPFSRGFCCYSTADRPQTTSRPSVTLTCTPFEFLRCIQ